MNLKLKKSNIAKQSSITITGSKSESNRLLLLQALFPEIEINNLSNSDDTVLMQKALAQFSNIVDIHHAGTAMRFLTAYYSTLSGKEVVITGSERMQERPIKVLVDALRDLGANIQYQKNEGFPPLKIIGKSLDKPKVEIEANVSSQYISALLLIAPKLKNGIELTLKGKITSVPYINMTLSLLNQIGVNTKFENNTIEVKPLVKSIRSKTLIVESDWSSASYFYSIVALSDVGTQITLSSYKKESLQGDSVLAEIYKEFGVKTVFSENSITLRKETLVDRQSLIKLDLSNAPDIAQTIAVTCLGLGVKCHLTGLHTLKIKETDRLLALKTEIEKLGTEVVISENDLKINEINPVISNKSIDTYNDHRMAMAFAPLALKTDVIINNAEVVSKSYPEFWNNLITLGIYIS